MRTHIDLFSGIGGFALAARWNGIQTVQFVELDPFCRKVLEKNFPGVPCHDDIKTFTYTESIGGRGILQRKWGDETIWDKGNNQSGSQTERTRPFLLTGGFPCQPFSCAGKRRGKEDDRYLWPEMLRVIQEARPAWVIGENVAGFINMGLDDCISDLENQGYEVQAFVIPACAVNAPHRRDRVWILGRRTDVDDSESGGCRILHTTNIREGCPQVNTPSVPDRHAPDTEGAGLARGKWEEHSGRGIANGCHNAWQEPWLEAATRLCRVDDGLPRQMDRVNRLKALGNAIVPQVAAEIINAIMEASDDHTDQDSAGDYQGADAAVSVLDARSGSRAECPCASESA